MNAISFDASGLQQLRVQIEGRLGLVIHEHQRDNLADTVREAISRFAYRSIDELTKALTVQPDGAPLLEHMITRLTVGESFFFRDAQQMEYLRREMLPALIERRRYGSRSLRVWSAACSAGQEIYSVAMLLRDLLLGAGENVASWRLHLLGTDINSESLQKAMAGQYSAWSMRAVDAHQRARHFISDPDGGARVRHDLQAMVRGLHVRAGGENLLIPSTSVDRIAETTRREVLNVAGSQALLVDGKPVALRELGTLLGLPVRARKRDDKLPVVLLARGWSRVAFLVDEVVGEREIVIKRLPPPLQAVPNISGATLTGNGEIMMVLNVDDLIDSAHQQSSGSPIEEVAEAPKERPHVLVVDDSITTRTLQKNMLEAQGFRVTVAIDGQMGWEQLERDNFALVITDVEMPRLNGFEFTHRIRESWRYPDLPVIIVTSLAKEADRRRGIEVGANAYIVKSEYESRALLDVVRQLV